MEILQEIGAYAGLGAILGLAVLSALYFSQARDVKRLREWAGRAPDRAPSPAMPEPRGVVAQPIDRSPARPVPGGTPPPVPRPPGPRPATAAAAGVAPAVAQGPELTGEGEREDEDAIDVTAMDTVAHPPPAPPDEDGAAVDSADGLDEAPDDDDDERDDYDDVVGDTGEWRPEDEHSGSGFTDEHGVVPATPAASAPRPPTPPRPYQRHGAPAPATGHARDRGPILPPYAEGRPRPDDPDGSSAAGGRRRILIAVVAIVAIAVVGFGALQLTGGDDSGGGDGAGLSAGGTTDDSSSGDGGGAPPIDPADVTVAVLNGTTVPGLAATVGDQIQGEGFQLGTVTNNFDQERAESVVLYAPGAEREAADVGRRLDISQREAIDAESQALAGDASVVVVAGGDQNQ
jgi:hypothetical protein